MQIANDCLVCHIVTNGILKMTFQTHHSCKFWFQLALYFQSRTFVCILANHEQELSMVLMFFVNAMRTFFEEDLINFILVKFASNWHSSFRRRFFAHWSIRNKNSLVTTFMSDQNEMRIFFCRGPYKLHFCKVRFLLAL